MSKTRLERAGSGGKMDMGGRESAAMSKTRLERAGSCTSQQKVDTSFTFYTSLNGHNTPYTVLESGN